MAGSFVRQNGAPTFNQNANSGVTSHAFAITTGATAGNTVVVTFSCAIFSGTTVTGATVTDTKGNTWTVDKFIANGIFVVTVIASTHQNVGTLANTDTITVAISGTGTPKYDVASVHIEEFAGLLTASSPADKTASNSGSGTSGATGTTATTTQAAEVAIVACGISLNAAITKDAAYTAFTTGSQTASNGVTGDVVAANASYKILAATGTQSATFTFSSGSYATAIVTYKAAAIVGAATVNSTLTIGGAGILTAKGAAALSVAFAITAAGTRTATGAAARSIVATLAAAGMRTAIGAAVRSSVLTITVDSVRTAVAAVVRSVVLSIVSAGARGAVGTGAMSLVDSIAVAGQRTAIAQSASSFVFTTSAAGARGAIGTADLSETLTIQGTGTKAVFGSATLPINIVITTDGVVYPLIIGSAGFAIHFTTTVAGETQGVIQGAVGTGSLTRPEHGALTRPSDGSITKARHG